MKFSIHNNNEYKEVKIESDNFTIETGLMDTTESVALAVELLETANDLLFGSEYESHQDTLGTIIEGILE